MTRSWRDLTSEILQLLVLAVLGAAIYAAIPEPTPEPQNLDVTPRPDHRTCPPWQYPAVTDGAVSQIVLPSEVDR